MKKICQFCFLFTLLVVSCTPEEEDLFNKTAAERISETIQQNLELLQGTSNGCNMENNP